MLVQLPSGFLLAEGYRIESLIGVGGMGAVYRATDTRTGSLVAVKTLRSTEHNTLERFAREARVLARITHPGIVRCLAYDMDFALPYLVMEWLEGETLAERLSRELLEEQASLRIVRAVASALDAVHAQGLTHRDIKPANIFLVKKDTAQVKVLDFGVVHNPSASRELTREGAIVGTVGYMSREQACGVEVLDARADVFSLGCVLYECLTGQPAYQGDNFLVLLGKLLSAPPPRLADARPEAPAWLDALLAKMLAPEREQRLADGAAVCAALDELPLRVEGKKVSAEISHRERRWSCLLVLRMFEAPPANAATVDDERPQDTLLLEKVRAAALQSGAELEVLPRGLLLLRWTTVQRLQEPTLYAASCALRLLQEVPSLAIACVTGSSDEESSSSSSLLASAEQMLALVDAATEGFEGVCLDAASAALLRERFVVRRQGTLYLLEGRLAFGGDSHGIFVGRERELARLREGIEDALEHTRAHAVVVLGPPGMGKTSVAKKLLALQAESSRVLFAQGDPVAAGAALAMPRQWLRHALGVGEKTSAGEVRARLEGHLSELKLASSVTHTFLLEFLGVEAEGRIAEGLRAARNDPRTMGEQVQRALKAWVAALSKKPLVLVTEDLQWFDQASVRLLLSLLEVAATNPCFVLLVARPEVKALYPWFFEEESVECLELSPLRAKQAEELVLQLSEHRLTSEAVARILRVAGGNPFVLEQLTRHVLEAGSAVAGLPQSILGIALARLERLDPKQRRIIRAASVLGTTFSVRALESLLLEEQQERGEVEGVLKELAARGLLDSVGSDTEQQWVFRHELLREGAYASLPLEDAQTAHLRAAEWYSAHSHPEPLLVGLHFERTRDAEKAIPWFLRAAKAALEAGDPEATLGLVERAVRLGAHGQTLGELHALAAQAAGLRGAWHDALRYARGACGLLSQGVPSWFVVAGGVIFSEAMLGCVEQAPGLVLQLRQQPLTGPASGPRLWGTFLAVTGLLVFGLRDEAAACLREAAEVLASDAYPDPAARGWFHLARGRYALYATENLAAALHEAALAVHWMEAAGSFVGRALALGFWGLAQLETGGMQEALRALSEATRLGKFHGSDALVWLWYTRALELTQQGEAALACVSPLLSDVSTSVLARNSRSRKASVLLMLGREEEAHTEALFPAMEAEAVAQTVLARIAYTRGDYAGALAAAERGLALDERQPFAPLDHTIAQTSKALALYGLGRKREAQEYLRAVVDRLELLAAGLPEEVRTTFLTQLPPNVAVFTLFHQWESAALECVDE